MNFYGAQPTGIMATMPMDAQAAMGQFAITNPDSPMGIESLAGGQGDLAQRLQAMGVPQYGIGGFIRKIVPKELRKAAAFIVPFMPIDPFTKAAIMGGLTKIEGGSTKDALFSAGTSLLASKLPGDAGSFKRAIGTTALNAGVAKARGMDTDDALRAGLKAGVASVIVPKLAKTQIGQQVTGGINTLADTLTPDFLKNSIDEVNNFFETERYGDIDDVPKPRPLEPRTKVEIMELEDLTPDVTAPNIPSETQTGLNQTAQTDTDSLMNLVGVNELDLSGTEGMTASAGLVSDYDRPITFETGDGREITFTPGDAIGRTVGGNKGTFTFEGEDGQEFTVDLSGKGSNMPNLGANTEELLKEFIEKQGTDSYVGALVDQDLLPETSLTRGDVSVSLPADLEKTLFSKAAEAGVTASEDKGFFGNIVDSIRDIPEELGEAFDSFKKKATFSPDQINPRTGKPLSTFGKVRSFGEAVLLPVALVSMLKDQGMTDEQLEGLSEEQIQTIMDIYNRGIPTEEQRAQSQQMAEFYADRAGINRGGITAVKEGGEIVGPGTGTSDSVPALLSDGEFVMTAKAVRNAGGGDREKGAAKMYALMSKLEKGAA